MTCCMPVPMADTGARRGRHRHGIAVAMGEILMARKRAVSMRARLCVPGASVPICIPEPPGAARARLASNVSRQAARAYGISSVAALPAVFRTRETLPVTPPCNSSSALPTALASLRASGSGMQIGTHTTQEAACPHKHHRHKHRGATRPTPSELTKLQLANR